MGGSSVRLLAEEAQQQVGVRSKLGCATAEQKIRFKVMIDPDMSNVFFNQTCVNKVPTYIVAMYCTVGTQGILHSNTIYI